MDKLVIVNPSNRSYADGNSFLLWFGAYGWSQFLVYAKHLDEAFDIVVDHIAEVAPGLLCNDQVAEEYKAAIEEGLSEDEAIERALEDVSTGGNYGNHVCSHEWGMVAESPPRTYIKKFIAEHGVEVVVGG